MFRVRVYGADAESLYALWAANLPERQNRHDRHRRLGVTGLNCDNDDKNLFNYRELEL
jgi:hypothetical protein